MVECDICREEHPEVTQSCSACNKVVKKYQNKTKYPMEEVRAALKHAYSDKDKDKDESYFKCEYTGIVSKFNSKNETLGTSKDAFILTLDHKDSGSKELVVSLNTINKMKSDIPFDKFENVVMLLGSISKKRAKRVLKSLK